MKPSYRVADLVKGYYGRNGNNRPEIYREHYPESFGGRYAERSPGWKDDYVTLLEIAREHPAWRENEPDKACVMHVRTGDVIENSVEVDRLWREPYYEKGSTVRILYVMPQEYFLEVVEELKEDGIREVQIISSLHPLGRFEGTKSQDYLGRIRELFAQHSIETSLVMDRWADDDIVEACNAGLFVQTGGGYSRLITALRERKAGEWPSLVPIYPRHRPL
ncbi:hypothetical protein [Roseibacillus ishigakijimensis]|uniref:Uncharacterized protein n=1 Tax=Roseibacillus ishigakijimensis TaxID=454146 RepID=A0A934VIH1_9BACT|nr:hypothetical protein [Roseibacillus ishigakijimensis]MBK1835068.1 hypothetical protein [Roseibacillus ishigakijimensis]